MKPSPAQLLQDRVKVALVDCLANIYKAHLLVGMKPRDSKVVVFFNDDPASLLGVPEVTPAELRKMAASLLNTADRLDSAKGPERE